MSPAELAGTIIGGLFALGFLIIVLPIARAMWKLGDTIEEAGSTVRKLSDETLPLIGGVTETVGHTNHQLQKVDTITTKVGVISDNGVQVATNVSALTALFAATLGSPVIKVAAFTYGVRQAMGGGRKPGATRGRRSKR
jgi:hypothetical protein